MKINPVTLVSSPNIIRRENEFPSSFLASSSLPLPRSIEKRGAPPIPTRLANAIVTVHIGNATPRPVSALVASFGILPIKILSIIL